MIEGMKWEGRVSEVEIQSCCQAESGVGETAMETWESKHMGSPHVSYASWHACTPIP